MAVIFPCVLPGALSVPHPRACGGGTHGLRCSGADATATFQRDAFGIVIGKDNGFDMGILLRIQIEARAAD